MAIQLYQNRINPSAPRVNDTPLARGYSLDVRNLPVVRLAQAFEKFGQGGLQLGKHWLDVSRTEDVIEATSQFQKDLASFADTYMTTTKGKDARMAGSAFEEYAKRRASEITESGSYDAATKLMLSRSTAPLATSFMNQGMAYGRQQDAAYKQSLSDAVQANLAQFVAANAQNDTLIRAQTENAKQQLMDLHPGMDMTAAFAKIDQQVTGNRIGAYLAQNDTRSARTLFERDIALLGDKADEYGARIRSAEIQSMNLALALEAKRDRLAKRQEEIRRNQVGREIVRLQLDGQFDKAAQLLDENRDVFPYKEYDDLYQRTVHPETASKDRLEALRAIGSSDDPSSEAERQYLLGNLTKSTFEDYSSAPLKDADKAATTYISRSFGGDSPDVALSATQGNALADYNQWRLQHPDATPQERQDEAENIVNRYSLIDASRRLHMLPVPPGLERSSLLRAKDMAPIQEYARNLVNDFKSGKINEAEFNRRAKQLKDLKKAVQRRVDNIAAQKTVKAE